MYEIIISKNAEDDLRESCVWYELQQSGLSKRFLKEFFRKINIIQDNPLLYPVKHKKGYSFAKLNIFPFFIVYKIDGNKVLVNAVFHTSRNPKDL